MRITQGWLPLGGGAPGSDDDVEVTAFQVGLTLRWQNRRQPTLPSCHGGNLRVFAPRNYGV